MKNFFIRLSSKKRNTPWSEIFEKMIWLILASSAMICLQIIFHPSDFEFFFSAIDMFLFCIYAKFIDGIFEKKLFCFLLYGLFIACVSFITFLIYLIFMH